MTDQILNLLVSTVDEDPEFQFEVTLIVDGFLVSGIAVGLREYINNNQLARSIMDVVRRVVDTDQEAKAALDNADDSDGPTHIHLKNAKYYTTGNTPIPGGDGVYCRIALEHVAGWHYGRFVTVPERE